MALPPSAYRQWKESAPEVASIEVLDASRKTKMSDTQGKEIQLRREEIKVDVKAKVLSVERTASNLKPNEEIQLIYTHRPLKQQKMTTDGKWADTVMIGAAPIPILEKGQIVTAWLRGITGMTFEPAAEAESFIQTTPAPVAATKTD